MSLFVVSCQPKNKTYQADFDNAPDSGTHTEMPELTDDLIQNLALLGKIWGFLKYHHPEVGKGKYDWDDELFQILPEYINVNSTRYRDKALLRWIERYGELPECTSSKETTACAYQKPDFLWVENGNISAALKEKIKKIYQNRHQGTHCYIKKAYHDGNPEFLNEEPYSTSFPDKNLRLLALYRYWNIIQYFFPYKYLTDKKWDEVLREYIPVFINAKSALEYQLAILQLAAETNDTHARFLMGADEIGFLRGTRYAPLRTNEIDSLRGTKYAPFRVRFIENNLTVIDYFKPRLKETTGLEIGDFITHIDSKKIEYIIDSIKAYYPASNEAARMYYMATDLVRSNNNSIHIVYNSSGVIKEKELTMYQRSDLNMDEPNSKLSYDSIMLDNDSMFIGYITLATIKDTEISHIKKSFMNAKGIIIDIRNYPASRVDFSLGEFFTSKRKPFVKFTTGNLNNPGEFNFSNNVYFLNYKVGNRNSFFDFEKPISENYFQGKLVVLVNEETISLAELTAMAFRAGDNTVVIGSQTQGADGNISFIPLPGGLKAGISGIGVYYPDGRGTQRIGIVPDIEVKPTIQGIREGRDEPLEKAIELIQKE
ncbi:S41 family peptidase [Maribellus luteus]|uniref:S41 family peptidase n=1 Tax=Maribellus luteus TaxID=2305463 RepID=UPI0018803F20|nr:S41 family peptidase [Maribellus luteus]